MARAGGRLPSEAEMLRNFFAQVEAADALGYGCAWVGHFGFEKNRPASFKRPLYSFMGDWVMYKDMWTGKIPF